MDYEIDFLPVGDGNADAIVVRYGDGSHNWLHVVDGGYQDTAETIIKHIGKYYRSDWRIGHIVLTHADNDHAAGLIGVMEQFAVGHLWMNRPWLYVDEVIDHFHGNYSRDGLVREMKERHPYLVQLEELAEKKGTVIHEVFQGAEIGPFTVLAPSRARYIELIPDMDKTPTRYSVEAAVQDYLRKAMGVVTEAARKWLEESWHIETLSSTPEPVSASNESSIVQLGNLDGKQILLTGDAGPQALTDAWNYANSKGLLKGHPHVVQVPHHGSRKNVTPAILDLWLGEKNSTDGAKKGSAVCSVGSKQDDYPRGQVKNAFRRRGYPVHATRGLTKCYNHNCDTRPGWKSSVPEPWADKVEA